METGRSGRQGAFAKQFQRDRAKLAAMGIAIESRQPEYSSKSEGQDFASYRLQLGDEPRVRLMFEPEDMPVLAAANYLARSMSISSEPDQSQLAQHASRTTPRVPQTLFPVSVWIRLRLAWARSPFRTRWSRLSIRVALPPPLMWTANT